MKQATHFIEVGIVDGHILRSFQPVLIDRMEWCLRMSKKHGIETIALFKIYPHPKPVIAEFDKEVNAIIIE